LPAYGADIGDAWAEFPAFVLMKDAANVAAYEEQLRADYSDVLELGVMKGGSCAFFEALLQPENHLAIDIQQVEPDGLSALAGYVAARGRRFRVDYRTSQDDIARILRLWQEMTGEMSSDAAFDLVIDDASHAYELSLRSFNGLFPLVRSKGLYVIEDWGWAHWAGPWQDRSHPDFSSPALSNLVVHAAFAVTGGSGLVESITVTPNATFVQRGSASSTRFRVEESYATRGRARAPF
jgi:hypothetical protein